MKDRKLYIWLVVIAILAMIWMPEGPKARAKGHMQGLFAPFMDVAASVSRATERALAHFRDANAFSRSADELAQEVFVLRERVRRVDELEQQNAELRRIIGFVEASPRQLIPCEVISRRDISGWWHGIRLDKGTEAGVTNNQAVVTYSGLVGRTVNVTESTADVLLVSDRNCRVAGRIVRLAADGIVRGDAVSLQGGSAIDMLTGFHPCRMDFVDKSAEVRVGDRVVTSGLGGIFPENVMVGRVVRYGLDESGLYQTATLAPAVDAKQLQYVFVVAR